MSAPDLDLSRAFDDFFDAEPEGPPIAHHVARGRRYVVRRRATAALAAAGVVAVMGTGFAAVDRAGDSTSNLPAISDPSGPPTPDATIQTDYDDPENYQDLARIHGYAVNYEGELLISDDVDVIERVDLPAGAGHADRSYGLRILRDGRERWIYAPWNAPADDLTGGPAERSVKPVAGVPFRTWLDGVVGEQTPQEPIDPAMKARMEQEAQAMGALEVDSHGRITLNPGAEIVERVDNPYQLTPPYESAALRVSYRGVETWWLTSPRGGWPELPGNQTFEGWLQRRTSYGLVFSASGPNPPLIKIDNERGMPELLANVEVVRRVGNPLGVSAPARSVGYWARLRDGSEWWYLWEVGPSGYDAAQVVRAAGDGYPSFEAWLADQRSTVRW